MTREALHYAPFGVCSVAVAAINEPIDFDGCKLFKAVEESGYRSVFDGYDKLVQIDKSYPAGFVAVVCQAMVVGGQLSAVAGPRLVDDDALLYVRL